MRKVKDILIDNKFSFNHRLGQNFITDTNLLNKIVSDSGITQNDTVLEIGTGAGTLTCALAEVAGEVISFEVDTALKPILDETLKGVENVQVIFRDILKMSDAEIAEIAGENFKVVANIPYYITTPIIMCFLEGDLKPKTLTFMVQKEVAERLIADKGTSEYGAITMAVKLYGDAKLVGTVSKHMFYPMPKVDSAIVRIDLNDRYANENISLIKRLIKSAFAMRRKTFVNNLFGSFGINKKDGAEILNELGFDSRIRGERFDIKDIIAISKSEKFLNAISK